jgi:hypothetical protein
MLSDDLMEVYLFSLKLLYSHDIRVPAESDALNICAHFKVTLLLRYSENHV